MLYVLLLLGLFIAGGLYSALKIQKYTLNSAKIARPVRLAVVSDLHARPYGERMEPLIRAIEAQKPDMILMPGDLFSDFRHDEPVEQLLYGLNRRWPVYYVTGNHECWSGDEGYLRKMAMLEKYGVTRLSGAVETVSVNGARLNIAGVDDRDANRVMCAMGGYEGFENQLDRVKALSQNGLYTVLIAHRPEKFGEYALRGFDLALCGHAHGGQWRVPGLLNGVYAPGQGLFPKLAGGLYRRGDTVMIVSRGLKRVSLGVPRFYNRPELVMVDLLPETGEKESIKEDKRA